MSTPRQPAKKLPPHGTRARYRLELKAGPGGKGGTACDRCRSANSKANADARANRRARAARASLTLVPDLPATDAFVDATADASTGAADAAAPKTKPAWGYLEQSVRHDLDNMPAVAQQVPFFKSLSAIAIERAREADTAENAANRSAATKQLFEVLKSLRGGRDDDGPTALDIVLEDFGLPLVPGGPA